MRKKNKLEVVVTIITFRKCECQEISCWIVYRCERTKYKLMQRTLSWQIVNKKTEGK